MIKKYRKKPVVIEAVRYTGNNGSELKMWSGNNVLVSPVLEPDKDNPTGDYVQVKTLEGTMIGLVGDYIIKGINGEFYPCKPDIFEATYEDASAEAETVSEHTEGLSFGKALAQLLIRKDRMWYMRLPHWSSEVKIRCWYPWPTEQDNPREMTAPFLYVESRFGRVPWKETMIELFSEKWEVGRD